MELQAAGVQLTLVAVLAEGESTADARKTLSSWGVQEPFLVDRGGAALGALGVKELPATAVIGNDEELRWLAPVGANAEQVVSAARAP